MSSYDVRWKFGEHEKSVRVARGTAIRPVTRYALLARFVFQQHRCANRSCILTPGAGLTKLSLVKMNPKYCFLITGFCFPAIHRTYLILGGLRKSCLWFTADLWKWKLALQKSVALFFFMSGRHAKWKFIESVATYTYDSCSHNVEPTHRTGKL